MIEFSESNQYGYKGRTDENVKFSDITLLLHFNGDSAGTSLTRTLAKFTHKRGLVEVNLHYWKMDAHKKQIVRKIVKKILEYLDYAKNTHIKSSQRGVMSYKYGENKLPFVKSKSTLEAIYRGERTSTTRHSPEQISTHSKLRIGDIVTYYDNNSEFVNVMVTNDPIKTKDIPKSVWCMLEGWGSNYYDRMCKKRLNNNSITVQYRNIPKTNRYIINIAGNGLSNCNGLGQGDVDLIVQDVINEIFGKDNEFKLNSELISNYNLVEVRSGGQTGVDESGIKAMHKLGYNTLVHAPKNWLFRDENKKDISGSRELFIKRFNT